LQSPKSINKLYGYFSFCNYIIFIVIVCREEVDYHINQEISIDYVL